MVTFRATIESNGKTATGVVVPEHIVTALGSGKRPAVRVTIGTYTYRSSIASMGGRFLLGISADVRTGARVAAGDVVDVKVERDTEPRVVTVPDDFAAALDAVPAARAFFDSLSYSNKSRHVLSIEGAKTPETRARRIEKSVTGLREGRA